MSWSNEPQFLFHHVDGWDYGEHMAPWYCVAVILNWRPADCIQPTKLSNSAKRLDSKISDLQRLWLYIWFLFLTLWRIRLVKRGLCPEVKTDVWNVRLQVLPFYLCTILWRVHGDRVLLYLHEYLGKHNNQFEVLTFLQIPQIHIWSNIFVPDKQLLQILECLRMHLKGFGRSWT